MSRQIITIRLRRWMAAQTVRLRALRRHRGAIRLVGKVPSIRRVVIAPLFAQRRDILDRVFIAPAVLRAWARHVNDVMATLPPFTPEQIEALQDEKAQEQPDGSLLICGDTPHGRVSMLVNPGQWVLLPDKK